MVISSSLCYWIITLVLLPPSEQTNINNFSTNPSSTSINRGGDVSFNCTFPLEVSISWNGPGVETGVITSSMKVDANTSTSTKTSTLAITNVNGSHAGVYFCIAEGDMAVNFTVVNLTVNYMTVDFTLDVFMVHENHSAMIPVHVTVFGTVHNATLVLHYGDSEDGPSLNRIINGTSGTQMLQIPTSPQLNCRAPVIQVRVTTNDPLVELEGSSTIFIYIEPTIGFEMTTYSVMEGDTVRVCAAVLCGSLLQETIVTLSTVNGTAKAGVDFIVPDASQTVITLSNSSRRSCTMIRTIFDNHPSNMDEQFQVLLSDGSSGSIIMMNITITNLPPPIIMPSVMKVSTGNMTGFEVITSFPVEAFQWQHNNRNISDGDKYSGATISTVMIMNIAKSDGGNYSCTVTTTFGLNVPSQQAQLKVFALPMITTEPVNITVNRNEAGLVFFTVTIQLSDEEFTYQWQRNGSDLMESPGKFGGVKTSMLTIIDAQNEDENSYQCVIYNGAGDGVRSNKAFLSVVDLPAMPVITHVSAGSKSIIITWDQDLSSEVQWYELQYNFTIRECEIRSGNVEVGMIDRFLRKYTLENSTETPIEEDSAYTVFLSAVNFDGTSDTNMSEISTQGATPSRAPENLRVIFTDDTSIVIQWEPVECAHRNGEITGYNVTYYPRTEMHNSMTLIVPESDRMFTATGLLFENEYIFEVQAFSRLYGSGSSANIAQSTQSIKGIVFVFCGKSYQNHSIVNFNVTGKNLLECFTDKKNCCIDTRMEEWIFPNGSTVRTEGNGDDFYRNRGLGVVNLYWKQNARIPTGIFCCETNPNQKACIGVYPEYMGIPEIEIVIYDPDTNNLVCTSSGGPATIVTWKRNGQLVTNIGTTHQQNQRVVFTENATYETTLRVPSESIVSYDATYECLVANSRGNSSYIKSLEAIQIVHRNLSIGKKGSLVCSSLITVDVIEWLNSNGEVIASNENTSDLSLIFAPVNISINNQIYTCRVNKSASVNRTVVVSVTVEDPLAVMIDGPSIIKSFGERVTINCTARIVLGVTQLPVLSLTHPNGTNLSSTEGRLISIVLDPVHIEDAGEYTCTGVIHLENITSVVVQAKQNFTFKLPTPKIGVAHNEGSLSVGSSTALNCTVKNYSIANYDVSFNVTWSRSGTILSNNSDRLVILNFNESLSTFTSQLILSPLSANDENITCTVIISPTIPNSFIEMSPTTLKQIQLNIEDPDITVQITSIVEDHNLTAGTNFSLMCTVDGTMNLGPEISFLWMHSNGSDFEEIGTYSSRLHFSSLKLSEAGEYMCQVNISSSLLRSDLNIMSMPPYPIRVFAPLPNVSIIPPSQAIFVGSSPNVTCVAEFDDTVDVPLVVNIAVYADGSAINPDYPVHMESYRRYTKTFTVKNIQANQEYLCVFLPQLSEVSPLNILMTSVMESLHVSLTVSITASKAIEIISSGKNIIGEKYNLTCMVMINGSSDKPSISWNGTVSSNISHDNGIYLSVLQFDPLQESHRGHYQCSVRVADVAEEVLQFNLTVLVPQVHATINGSGGIPIAGQPYTLSCSISGDEKLNSSNIYQWILNNGTEMPFEANSISLSFSSLSLSNSGNYSCRTVVRSSYLNEDIITTSNFFSIQLQAPSPSSVVIIPPSHTIFTGQSFHISCIVHLLPTVDIPVSVNVVWNGPVQNCTSPALMTETPTEYSSSAMFVSDVQSETISFQCTASVDSDSPFITESESTSANKSIFVVGRPSQPIGLNASAGSTFINLTWNRTEKDIVHGYELQYDYSIKECQNNTGMMMITQISNTTNSHTLEHLEEDSEFNISLIAFNPAGRSEPATLMATTLPSAPTGAPQDLNITSFDFTNVTIQWNPVECSQRNGKIDGYRLIYYPTVNSNDNESILIDGSSTNNFIIVGLQPRVNYTLTLTAVSGNYSLFGNESRRTVQTSMPQAIAFLFHGKVYGNNSIVTLTKIGEGRNALLCITTKTDCCRGKNPPIREWYFPNESLVRIMMEGDSFYRNRDISIVRLNRRNNATSPTGIFQCEIPSSSGLNTIIHIGIYHTGKGIPTISSFNYSRNSMSLNCISTGGPVTTVIWRKNNQQLSIDGVDYQQTQIIVNSENAEYRNILYSNNAGNLVGVFTCIVQNARGSDNMTISTNGVVIEYIAETYTVQVGETYTVHVGSNTTITCRSDTTTMKIEWLYKGMVIAFRSMTTQLDLPFMPVNDSIHDRVYICRVTRNNTEVAEQNFTIGVEVPTANTALNLNIDATRNTSIAGESNTFICTVSKNIQGLKYLPRVVWVENDMEIAEQNVSLATLTFTTLNTSHGGVYTCRGNLSSPALSTPLILMEHYSVVVKIPTPSINIVLPGGTLYAGTNLSVVCGISTDAAVDSDISVDVTWLNGSLLISNGTERVFISPHSGAKPSFTSTLFIHPLVDVDNSNFTCQASIHSDSQFINQSNVGESSIHIPVEQRIPSAPNIVIENITSTGINLTWSQEAYDFIKGFTITAIYIGPCNDFDNVTLISSHPSRREASIKGLQEFSNYSIVIAAFNDAGHNLSQVNITTKPSVPDGSPNGIRNTSVRLTSVTISWNSINCIQQNSIIHSYVIHYRKSLSESALANISTLMTMATINNLDPRTKYVFEIQGINDQGQKGLSDRINVTTSAPTAVGFLLNDSHSGNKSVVSLDEIGEGGDALVCLTNNFSCCEEMTVGIWYFPNSSQVPLGHQGSGHDVYVTRGPSLVRLHQRRNSMLPAGLFHCKIPDTSGINQSIYVGIYPDHPGAGAVMVEDLRFDKRQQTLSCTSTGGPPTTVEWTKNGQSLNIDDITHSQTQTITDESTSMFVTTIFIHRRRDLSGIIGNYSCRVSNSRGTNQRTFEIQGLKIMGHESSYPHGSSVHLNCSTDLTADTIEWLDLKGKVLSTGNGSSLGLIHTPSDSNNAEYTCRVNSTFGSQNETVNVHIMQDVSPSLLIIPIIVIITVLAVVVIVIIVVIVFMRRKHQGKLNLFSGKVKSNSRSRFLVHVSPLRERSQDSKKGEHLVMTTYRKYKGAVVSMDDFNNYVKNMHDDRDQLFEKEYSTISKEPLNSYSVAEIMVNKIRNRFGNIFPYDHCRVKLKELAGIENSDYINASYLDGYQKPSAYIAAQGPLSNTLEDFWRMIWEKRLTTIIMLTQCFEGRKKCECYWPENINDTFEPGQAIKVVLTSTVPFSEYTVRKMTVTRTTEPQLQPLEVIQFHFVAWPDHGVPDNCAVMLNFIRRVRKLHPYSNPCPLLVHCSAGVGRTGTFIVLDTMLERMKTEDTLNIYDYVQQLREQRVLMVQTLAQYMFIHDALKEYILCGQTEIIAGDIRNVIDNLSVQHDPCSAASGFEHQFQILGQLQYVTEENSYSNATSEQNIGKNRYSNKLPNNFYRVCLKSSAVPGSDYINASFIHGYRQKKTYIATQGPLESTVCDFWRMVWENECKCVVLLSQLKENNKEMCCCYWPSTEGYTQTYGQITVKFLAEERYGYCDLRKFEIDEEKAGVEGVKTAFTVTQFHFLEWPEHETPPITSSLIELMGNVNKVQMGAASKPMVVMCNDGVGRTGTFICIHAQLERLKTEGVFDFFQFIKSARMQRAGLVSDNVQYVLCHEVLADYLDSFDTYANFKEVM